MSKKRTVILICLLAVILGFVLFLSVDSESELGRLIYGNAIMPAMLFFVFFGAFAGVLKIVVDLAFPDRLPKTTTSRWGITRTKGKVSYVVSALLFYGIPLIGALAIQVAVTELNFSVIRNFIVLGVVLICGIAAIAVSLWKYQERIYLNKSREETTSGENHS